MRVNYARMSVIATCHVPPTAREGAGPPPTPRRRKKTLADGCGLESWAGCVVTGRVSQRRCALSIAGAVRTWWAGHWGGGERATVAGLRRVR